MTRKNHRFKKGKLKTAASIPPAPTNTTSNPASNSTPALPSFTAPTIPPAPSKATSNIALPPSTDLPPLYTPRPHDPPPTYTGTQASQAPTSNPTPNYATFPPGSVAPPQSPNS